MKDTSTRLGAVIADLRLNRHWTQRESAKWSGISLSQWRKIETGRQPRPKLATLDAMGKALGVETWMILFMCGPCPPQGEWSQRDIWLRLWAVEAGRVREAW